MLRALAVLLVSSGATAHACSLDELMGAIRSGDRPAVAACVRAGGFDVNQADGSGNTPLIEAAAYGMDDPADMVGVILEKKPKVDALDSIGGTALMAACKQRRLAVVKALLAAKADPNVANNQGQTALLLTLANATSDSAARQKEAADIVDALVKAGAKLTVKDGAGRTALMAAIAQAKPDFAAEVAPRLLAELDTQDTDERWTAMMYAAQRGNVALVDLLAAKKANVNARDKRGNTALMLALLNVQEQVSGPMVKALVGAGADVDLQNDEGKTALVIAIDARIEPVALQLLKAGANPNKADKQGRTALIAAAHAGSWELVEALAGKKADLDAADETGMTALMDAAEQGNTSVVAMLLLKGAKKDLTDKAGKTALARAEARSNTPSAELLRGAVKPQAFTFPKKELACAEACALRFNDCASTARKSNKQVHEKVLKCDDAFGACRAACK